MRSALLQTVMLGAAFLLGSGTARAAEILEFNVPFPFVVNHETFPAGHYAIEEGAVSGPSVLLIRGMSTPQSTFITTHTASGLGPRHPTLEFAHRENQYLLKNIWESPKEGQSITIQR